MAQVLIISPSRKTRGGITAVVRAYETADFWKRWNCHWIETHVDRGNFLKVWYFIAAFFSYLPKLPGCDLIHIHLSEPVNAIRKSFFAIPAILLRKPIILHFHSFSAETTIESRWKPLYRFLFRHATAIVVLSPSWKEAVQKSFGPLPIEVISNPCPIVAADGSKPVAGRPFILYAGTLIPRKGYSELIRAYATLADSHPEWDLVLAGNGEMDLARSLAEQLGIASRVRLPGWVSGLDKAGLFRRADIFCLPSYAEGFPMAVLDAFAYGLPVVTTPVGGIPDILEDGVSASFVPCGDTQALATALMELMEDPYKREAYSNKGLELSRGTFSLEAACWKIEALYERCLPEQNRP